MTLVTLVTDVPIYLRLYVTLVTVVTVVTGIWEKLGKRIRFNYLYPKAKEEPLPRVRGRGPSGAIHGERRCAGIAPHAWKTVSGRHRRAIFRRVCLAQPFVGMAPKQPAHHM